MKHRIYMSLVGTLTFFGIAIYMFYETQNYINSIIWILLMPITISLHPYFYRTHKELQKDKESYDKTKKILNFSRVTIFGFGLLLFLYQFINDIF